MPVAALLVLALATQPATTPAQPAPSRPVARAEAYQAFLEARRLEAANDSTGAVAAFERAAALDPSPAILTELAQLYARLDRADDARRTAERALTLDPAFADAHWMLGMLSIPASAMQGDNTPVRDRAALDRAIGHLEKAMAGRAYDLNIPVVLGRLYLQTDRAADAARVLRGVYDRENGALEAGVLLAQAREARAGALARAEASDLRRVEMNRVAGERFECPPPLLPERIGFVADEVREAPEESARHDRLNLDRERLGPVNLIAEQELRELEAELERSLAEREELAEAVNRLRGSIGSLNREGRARLLAAFEQVDRHFRRLFERLFGGGEAYLQLVDSDDPLEAGLEIMAQPPGKRLGSLTLLSGGEQALTAVALIFALFLTKPSPICVLDEVDAPLDDANVERFCDLLDAMVADTDTRYLIVTHNAVTMSRMHRLFGVTMVERGVSRLVSVDLGGAEELLAAE